MAINPIAFARAVNEQFLRYQLTAFPLADEALARQTCRDMSRHVMGVPAFVAFRAARW